MAGGTFDKTVGKVRPGTYVNFKDTAQESIKGSARGTVLLPLINTDYGPAGEMISLNGGAPDAARAKLGYSVYDDDPAGNIFSSERRSRTRARSLCTSALRGLRRLPPRAAV